LVRDRWYTLALRAFTSGLTSFSLDERKDTRWRLKEELMLMELERIEAFKLHRMVHEAESAAAQYSAGSNVFEHHYNRARKQYTAASTLLLPYRDKIESVGQVDMDSSIDAWKEAFGNPDSEIVQRTIEFLRTD
jgi:hypothetical protein